MSWMLRLLPMMPVSKLYSMTWKDVKQPSWALKIEQSQPFGHRTLLDENAFLLVTNLVTGTCIEAGRSVVALMTRATISHRTGSWRSMRTSMQHIF
ncbi:hypothetical protein WQE_15471 [Paraburkholderia hospita]|uniref:Uncharacterized protein n=1 Tax=Paraburkholderia hospita TaxID=169430 RepID=A0ABN0FNW8_9BURK|nr:hypothetical protein WQE_15471 [Paraburkholderia hospita]